ncbi:MAG TPA: hypothetical protein VE263_05000 [Candidatus Angelobacter sp.]|nr:hypothetical protein [Candidatus Angelobacter sp.]
MPATEGKIANLVLNRIRALKTAPASGEGADYAEHPTDIAKQVSLREAQFSDFEQVCALNLRLGQGPDSVENWRRLWRENPALAGTKEAAPIGWVLETSHEIVGFLGSIPLQYEFRGAVLRAAATCRFAVDPAYRAFSHLLVVSFFRQKNIDLFLNTTATAAAAKMMTAVKASPMPQSDYGTVLFWVLDARQFTKAVFDKMGVQKSLQGAGSAIAALLLKADRAIRSRAPRATSSKYRIQKTSVHEAGPEFERLWSDFARHTPRLWARHSWEVLRWHFDPPGNRRVSVVLGCYAGDELMGYAVVRHEPCCAGEIRRSLVADLLAREDDPEVVEQLLAAALGSAQDAGCHVLEVMGFPDSIRQVARRSKPYARGYPAHPFYFKARDRDLQEALIDRDAWYACPFDGDATLWP